MKRALKVTGCLMVVLFGATFAHAAWEENRDLPRRVRQEMASKEHRERASKEREMTSEEKMQRKEASERRRAAFRKYVIHPIKRLQPHRHPTKGREEEIRQTKEERKENLNRRFGWLVPHRHPSSASGASSTHIQPASYSTGETK